ncbi:MAG: hypothetical protein AUK03_03995 [Anaerolineae bacterium CG2_30_64_16]|nr:MAG: hypothetical protein AUK03_03995 [Anaerolineae bacterium CG2_30_64_16]
MENKKDRTLLIAVITGVITLLLGLCLGALAGGVGGYLIGRSAAPEPVELPGERLLPQAPPDQQVPELPVPEFRGPMAPEGMPQSGALVREVVADTPAEQAGLKLGDLITRVDETPVDANHRLADVLGQYQPGDQVELTIWRWTETLTLSVKLGPHPDSPRRAYLGIMYTDFSLEQQAPGD